MKISYYSMVIFSVFLGVSCVSTSVSTDPGNVGIYETVENEMHAVISQVSDYLLERLPMNTRVSLLNISEDELDTANFIVEKVSSKLVDSGELIVVARNNLTSIQMEQDFNLSGAVSDESFIPIGKFFSAQSVITCSIVKRSGKSQLIVRALDVETTQIKADRSFELVSLSTDRVLQNSLPVIEKQNSEVPDFVYDPPQPDDQVWGIGVAHIIEPYENARDRAVTDIAQRIIHSIKDEVYERLGGSKGSWREAFIPQAALAVSRYAIVERRVQTNDGKIWYLLSLEKNRFNELLMALENFNLF
jgi:hypothetical protein